MTSCAEWTGVLLSTLLKEAGVQEDGDWIVAEGVEEVKGASSIPMAKAMEDCLVCYGMNGEAVRPQQGYPLRLLVPGFGAQGGGAADVAGAFDESGLGAIVNSSRGIIFAHARDPYRDRFGDARWQEAVEAATHEMISQLRDLTPAGQLAE